MSTRQTQPTDLSGSTALTRLRHRCGRFLGEWRDGTIYVLCARCKDLVPVVRDEHPTNAHVAHDHQQDDP